MLELDVAIGDYPHTRPLREGALQSDLVSLNFVDIKPVNRAFAPMLRRQEFDVCEMALGAFLQATDFNKPIQLLPVPTMCGIHHRSLVYRPENGPLSPADLKGRRVGIRAYTQTTGLWLRGILEEEHGIAHDDIQWVVLEGPHVEEYVDPSFVSRAPDGAGLLDLLRSGAVDALVGAPAAPDVRELIPNAAAAERGWLERVGSLAINHLISVDSDLAAERPDVVIELYRLFRESRRMGMPEAAPVVGELPQLVSAGVGNVRPAVELAIDLAHRQGMIRSKPLIEDLFPVSVSGPEADLVPGLDSGFDSGLVADRGITISRGFDASSAGVVEPA